MPSRRWHCCAAEGYRGLFYYSFFLLSVVLNQHLASAAYMTLYRPSKILHKVAIAPAAAPSNRTPPRSRLHPIRGCANKENYNLYVTVFSFDAPLARPFPRCQLHQIDWIRIHWFARALYYFVHSTTPSTRLPFLCWTGHLPPHHSPQPIFNHIS